MLNKKNTLLKVKANSKNVLGCENFPRGMILGLKPRYFKFFTDKNAHCFIFAVEIIAGSP